MAQENFIKELVENSLGSLGGRLAAVIMAFLVLFLVVFLAIYIYMSFAFMAIGRKAKLKTPGLAWIPIFGPLIIAYQTSEMRGWTWSFLVLGILIPLFSIISENINVILVGFVFSLILLTIFGILVIIWQWEMFRAVGKPGWWALLQLGSSIPYVGSFFYVGQLIVYGIAAWSKD